jgi:hypothetical protein
MGAKRSLPTTSPASRPLICDDRTTGAHFSCLAAEVACEKSRLGPVGCHGRSAVPACRSINWFERLSAHAAWRTGGLEASGSVRVRYEALSEQVHPDFNLEDELAEAVYQFGRTSTALATDTPRFNVSATFFHLEAGNTFQARWKPRVSFEHDRASGDEAGGHYGRFDTLFGMRRAISVQRAFMRHWSCGHQQPRRPS